MVEGSVQGSSAAGLHPSHRSHRKREGWQGPCVPSAAESGSCAFEPSFRGFLSGAAKGYYNWGFAASGFFFWSWWDWGFQVSHFSLEAPGCISTLDGEPWPSEPRPQNPCVVTAGHM